MIYLLAKYTLLFLLATVLGFVLGYWWSRRKIVDVTESYEDLRKATERTDNENWERLWSRLDALPAPKETDLNPVFEHLDGVRSAIVGIPTPDPVDFAPVESRLESLAEQIANIPRPATPKDPDLKPLADRIESLDRKIRAIPAPLPPQELDLKPVHNDLSSIREQIRELPKVETHGPVSLTPVIRQIDALDKRVSAIPQPDKVDLTPINGRLRTIESKIEKLDKRLERETQKSERKKSAPRKSRSELPKILSAAIYGRKDDLKRISGVGPKLEQLMNKNGVYYYWQVASWSRKDIESIDQRLETFKGRITRDDWVSQAKQLKRSPEAAQTPTQ